MTLVGTPFDPQCETLVWPPVLKGTSGSNCFWDFFGTFLTTSTALNCTILLSYICNKTSKPWSLISQRTHFMKTDHGWILVVIWKINIVGVQNCPAVTIFTPKMFKTLSHLKSKSQLRWVLSNIDMYHQMYRCIYHGPWLMVKVQKCMRVFGMAHSLHFLKWHWLPAFISRFPAVISWFPAVISIQGQV